jgi:hypothetical protein
VDGPGYQLEVAGANLSDNLSRNLSNHPVWWIAPASDWKIEFKIWWTRGDSNP